MLNQVLNPQKNHPSTQEAGYEQSTTVAALEPNEEVYDAV
jgi:hypothetical protein